MPGRPTRRPRVHSSGLPGPKGNRETFVWLAEAGRPGRRAERRGDRAHGASGGALSVAGDSDIEERPQRPDPTGSAPGARIEDGASPHGSAKNIAVFTHRRTEDTREALQTLIEDGGVPQALRCASTRRRLRKHALRAGPGGGGGCSHRHGAEDLCVVLGGGREHPVCALRSTRAQECSVFAINFVEIGALATVEPEDMCATGSPARRAAVTSWVATARDRSVHARGRGQRRTSTTSRSTAVWVSGSPSSPTRSTARRLAACAAMGSCSPRPRAPPATTSPMAVP